MHDTPGMLIVPPGMIVAIAGQHSRDEDGASGMRWGKLDYQKNATVEACAKDVTEMMNTYEELRANDEYKAWLGIVKKVLT